MTLCLHFDHCVPGTIAELNQLTRLIKTSFLTSDWLVLAALLQNAGLSTKMKLGHFSRWTFSVYVCDETYLF